MSTIDRRRFLALASAVGGSAALAACAGPDTSSPGETPAAGNDGAATSGPISGDISFAHWRAEDTEVFDQLIAAFVEEHADATVTQDISPSNDYQSTALQKIRGGDVGDAFTAFRGAQFVQMASAGLFVDLSDAELVSRYIAEHITAGQSDGKQLGLPYQLVFNMPMVNEDILSEAGVSALPEDWDGWLSMCEQLKGAGFTPIAWPGGEPGNAGQLFNSMVMNNMPADDAMTGIEEGRYKVTEDWFLRTLEQYAELTPYFQANSSGTAVEPAQLLFASGEAAMLATGSYHAAGVRALGGEFPLNLAAPITTTKDEAKYEGIYNATFILGVNSASQNQDGARAWLDFLSRPENAGTYANGTGQHVTVDGVEYTNADLEAMSPWLSRTTLLAPRFQFNNLDIRNAVEGACTKVVSGTPVEQAAEDAQQIVDQQRG